MKVAIVGIKSFDEKDSPTFFSSIELLIKAGAEIKEVVDNMSLRFLKEEGWNPDIILNIPKSKEGLW